jgi:hypothetical protein
VRVAVVGAGLFGCLSAVELARAGHEVDLYERHRGILHGATRANQGRLHMGYHYPRSPATAAECRTGAAEFVRRFPEAVISGGHRYYCLAPQWSKTSAEEYRTFCRTAGLPWTVPASVPLLRADSVDAVVTVGEGHIDVAVLRAMLWKELRLSGVQLHLGTDVDSDYLPADLVVLATYGRGAGMRLRWEVCETALVKLGQHFAGKSFVVMDGPFVSVDPYPGSDLHMLYDVQHSVHHANEGTAAQVPDCYAEVLDRGVVHTRLTRMDSMCATARRYLRGTGMPEYRGSLFTVRAVLPGVDDTDARPTLVQRGGDRIVVLGGKLDTAVSAARRVTAAVRDAVPVP